MKDAHALTLMRLDKFLANEEDVYCNLVKSAEKELYNMCGIDARVDDLKEDARHALTCANAVRKLRHKLLTSGKTWSEIYYGEEMP